MTTKELDNMYVSHTYGRFPIEIVRGEKEMVYDETGKEYIDLSSGIAVSTFGHSDKELIKAATEQMKKFFHTSNLYYSAPCANLAKLLCDKTGAKKVFFSNSGAEANECAIKAAREYAAKTKGEDYYTIITLKNSFHGRTITTLAATGQDTFHQNFLPLTNGFVYGIANDINSVKELVASHKCAAIMFELVQGEGGVMPLSKDFVIGLSQIAKENDLVLIADEVQTGNGRTGKLYAYMHYGITPDIVTTAKGLSGGLPIGATMFFEKTKDIYSPGMHGSTFGGNPVSCAAGISVISRIDEKLLSDVAEKGEYIKNSLTGYKGVKSVSGLGLMIGIETEKDAKDVVALCRENGVLVITAKTKVRLLPPLNISKENLQKAIEIIKKSLV